MSFTRTKTLLAALAAAALIGGPAAAQLASNSDAPVDITADEVTVVNNECLSVWSGKAEALQDTSRLRADVLKTYFKVAGTTQANNTSSTNCGELDRIEALGNVFYVTPDQRVRGRNALYEAASETITITGDVVAVQGQNVLRGERLVINSRTGQAQMQTDAKGRDKPGRVRGVFYPDKTPTAQPR